MKGEYFLVWIPVILLLLRLVKEGNFVVLFLVVIVCALIALFVAKIVVPMVKFVEAKNLIDTLYANFTFVSENNYDDYELNIVCTDGQEFEFSNLDELLKVLVIHINKTLEYYDKKFGWMSPTPSNLESDKKELIEILSKLRCWHWERYGVENN